MDAQKRVVGGREVASTAGRGRGRTTTAGRGVARTVSATKEANEAGAPARIDVRALVPYPFAVICVPSCPLCTSIAGVWVFVVELSC
jgi:hypothetical protein